MLICVIIDDDEDFMSYKVIFFGLLLSISGFGQPKGSPENKGEAAGRPVIRTLTDADNYRKTVLQALQVAQNPVHTKQDKATELEIAAYAQAAERVVDFKNWLIRGSRISLSLKILGNSNDIMNRKRFMKSAWAIHDAEVKTQPPFNRNDIGVAIKVMNDARELFQLPVVLGSERLDEDDR